MGTTFDFKTKFKLARVKAIQFSTDPKCAEVVIHIKNEDLDIKTFKDCVDGYFKLTHNEPGMAKTLIREFVDSMKHAYFGLRRKNIPILTNNNNILVNFVNTTSDLKKGNPKKINYSI